MHPLVAEKRQVFLDICRKDGKQLVVLDIPLLYETGAEKEVRLLSLICHLSSNTFQFLWPFEEVARILLLTRLPLDDAAQVLSGDWI